MYTKQKKLTIEVFVPNENLSVHNKSPVWLKFERLCQFKLFTLDDLQFYTPDNTEDLDIILIFSNSTELITSILSQKNLSNKVIMVGNSLDVKDYKYLKGLGMLDYIHEHAFEEELTELLQDQLAVHSENEVGQIIALTSASETSYVSDVCLFLASNLTDSFEGSVVIFDLNLFHSYIASKLDLPLEGGLGQLLLTSEDLAAELDDALIKTDQGYWALYDNLDPELVDENFELVVSQILVYLRLRFSTVLVTIPAARPELNAAFNKLIDRLVFVTTDSVSSVKSNILYAKNINKGDLRPKEADAIVMVSSVSLRSPIVFDYLQKRAPIANIFILEQRNNILQRIFKRSGNNVEELSAFKRQKGLHPLVNFLSIGNESGTSGVTQQNLLSIGRFANRFISNKKAVTALEFSLLIPFMVSISLVLYALSAVQMDRARFSLYQSELRRYLNASQSTNDLILFHNSIFNQVNDEFKFSRLGDLTVVEQCSCDSVKDINVTYSCEQGFCESGDLRVNQIVLNLSLNVDLSSIPILKDIDMAYDSSVFDADL